VFAVEFDVGDLTLLAHLCVVDVLVWDPGQAKPSLKLDAEGGNTAYLKYSTLPLKFCFHLRNVNLFYLCKCTLRVKFFCFLLYNFFTTFTFLVKL
jgi:hypothetical protein